MKVKIEWLGRDLSNSWFSKSDTLQILKTVGGKVTQKDGEFYIDQTPVTVEVIDLEDLTNLLRATKHPLVNFNEDDGSMGLLILNDYLD